MYVVAMVMHETTQGAPAWVQSSILVTGKSDMAGIRQPAPG